jgi:hypothetical protein
MYTPCIAEHSGWMGVKSGAGLGEAKEGDEEGVEEEEEETTERFQEH